MLRSTVVIIGFAAAAFLCPVSAKAQHACDNTIADTNSAHGLTTAQQLDQIEDGRASMLRDRRYRRSVQSGDYQGIIGPTPLITWAFTTPAHPAYPSVVCREAYQNGNGDWLMVMRISCFGTIEVCDRLVADFSRLNAQMRDALQRQK